MSDWIYGIVAVMLFGTVILQVTPVGTYQKYVRLFFGALLILTVMGPLYSWFDLSEETRLSFEQGVLSSWFGVTSLRDGQREDEWKEPDRWEKIMKEQVSQKQEVWVQQVLESTAGEYGFLYWDHQVQWNPAGNWPERLILWVKKAEDREAGENDGFAAEDLMTEDTEAEVIRAEDSRGIPVVDPIAAVSDSTFDVKGDAESQNYYEPSELRPLHQALQVVWQLEEGQIVLYWHR